ncbi:MAG: hypothetical protein HQM00_14220 [Magnetococcales bacterium]|nr:hypothetical protein [Magnetococcales bacterium]
MGSMDFTDWVAAPRGNRVEPDVVMASAGNTRLYLADAGNTLDGVAMTATLIRTGLRVAEDPTQFVRLVDLWPMVEASGTIQIRVGTQRKATDSVTWGSEITFDPATREHLAQSGAVNVTGRLLAVQFSSETDVSWELASYGLEIRNGGRF